MKSPAGRTRSNVTRTRLGLRVARRVLLLAACLPMLQLSGCLTFNGRVLGGVVNVFPATVFNAGLNLIVSLLTGTSSFLLQSGGQFNGGFGS